MLSKHYFKSNHAKIKISPYHTFPQTDIITTIAATPITLHIAITIRGALFLDCIWLKKDIFECFLHIPLKLLQHIVFAFTTSYFKSNHGNIRIFTYHTFPQTDIIAKIAATPLFETNTLRIAYTIHGPLCIQLSWIRCTQYNLQMSLKINERGFGY